MEAIVLDEQERGGRWLEGYTQQSIIGNVWNPYLCRLLRQLETISAHWNEVIAMNSFRHIFDVSNRKKSN